MSRELLIEIGVMQHDRDALLEVCRLWLHEFGDLDQVFQERERCERAASVIERTRLVVASVEAMKGW